jgi:hypothetical protein
MAPRDPIALVLGSIGAGASSGAAVITVGMIVLRMTSLAQTEAPETFTILMIATMAGIVVAIATAWHLTSSIADTWRRGVACAVATMLGLIVSAATAPADMLGGVIALIALLLVFVVVATFSFRGATGSGE